MHALGDDRPLDPLRAHMLETHREHESRRVDDLDLLSAAGAQGAGEVASVAAFDHGALALAAREECRQA